jgi:2,3-dihydroxybiphenyl 1,2-dioxygenase
MKECQMREDLQLGYLVFEAADAAALDATFTDVLGMTPVPSERGRAYRMDEWDRRFVVLEAETDRLAGAGLVAADSQTFDAVLDRLKSAGVPVREGTAEGRALRAVRRYVTITDPAGIPVELAEAPSIAPGRGFLSPAVPGGFLTGAQGLGHIVALADDRAATVAFYTDVIGFSVSDTVEEETPAGAVQATFLHCNRRHHTIAIGQRAPHMPKDKILGHFMVQANEIDAVGMAYDRALDAGLPIFRTLGRHPNDGMFSFYLRTTAGFDIEFGAGAREIHDDWQVVEYHQASAWGHRRGQGFTKNPV